MKSEAYLAGKREGQKAEGLVGLHRNPYPEKTKEHDEWSLGWTYGWVHQDE